MNYNPKQLFIGEEGREKLISGITKLSSAVKSTMGAGGRTVLIESPHHTNGITITKDGATVAKSVELLDAVENMACNLIKEASINTAATAGDGSTLSIVLTEAIILNGIKYFQEHPEVNMSDVLREMHIIKDKIIEAVKEKSIETTPELIRNVATVSTNNDEFLGNLIADIYEKVGKDGFVHFDKSKTGETYSEYTDGIKVEMGYTSPYFANNEDGDVCELKGNGKVKVLVTDLEISNMVNQLNKEMLEEVIRKGESLLFIAPTTNQVVNAIILNTKKNNWNWCVVPPPAIGWKQKELLNDIALSVGGKFYTSDIGDGLQLMTYDDLGTIDRAVVTKNQCVLYRDKTNSEINEQIEERVKQLKSSLEKSKRTNEKDFLRKRIGSLTGGVGIVYAGGASEIEQKELYDRIEDAVLAVRSALEEGVVAGGGVALRTIGVDMLNSKCSAAEKILGSSIVKPCEQILENCGYTLFDLSETIYGQMGYNVRTMKHGDMIEMGICDPVKVIRVALENAVSVSTTILSTNAIVTMARDIDKGI